MADAPLKFTVILPINRPPNLLPFAIDSVLGQTVEQFQLFIVCDGAPDETVSYAESRAKSDHRIKVFAFAKGERHGEAHRHDALSKASAPYVAHIGDDDVWFPNHLAALERVLERSDFGNVLQADVLEHGGIRLHTGDLANAQTRQRMCEDAYNFFGPSSAGYRLSAYRRLPEGWAPAPLGVWTDLHMWRKFLARKDMSFGTEFSITLMKISAAERTHLPIKSRESESRGLVTQFAEGSSRDAFIARAFKETILSLSEHVTALVRDRIANDTKNSELLAALESDLSNARADLRRANIQLAQCHEHLATLQIVALERDSLLLSTSWAVTRPLRWLKRLLTARRT